MAEPFTRPWVLQKPMSPLRQLLQASFADAGFGALPNWIETSSVYATLKIVMQTDMVTCLPRTLVEEGVATNDLVRLPVALGRSLESYGIVTRRGEEQGENAQLFARILRDFTGNGA